MMIQQQQQQQQRLMMMMEDSNSYVSVPHQQQQQRVLGYAHNVNNTNNASNNVNRPTSAFMSTGARPDLLAHAGFPSSAYVNIVNQNRPMMPSDIAEMRQQRFDGSAAAGFQDLQFPMQPNPHLLLQQIQFAKQFAVATENGASAGAQPVMSMLPYSIPGMPNMFSHPMAVPNHLLPQANPFALAAAMQNVLKEASVFPGQPTMEKQYLGNNMTVQPTQSIEISRKRSSASTLATQSCSSDDDEESSGAVRSAKREKLMNMPGNNSEMGLGGESRLKISFSNLGTPGDYPQVFGKSRLGVPDGLSGTYVLYSERWRSEIFHEKGSMFESPDGTKHALITWKITNLTSGVTQSRTETPKEALLRHKDGRTLCNKVFRRALEHRATELENELTTETNPIRVKTMRNLVKKLRPKHFSEGPLVFGLRHECVQNRFKNIGVTDDCKSPQQGA